MVDDVLWEDDDDVKVPRSTAQKALAVGLDIGYMSRVEDLPVASAMPPNFPLHTLLTFVPDVALKNKLAKAAEAALALDVTTDEGMQAADTALVDIKAQVAHIMLCFDGTATDPGPARLAGQLHKRLTGLRGDFCNAGETAATVLDRRLLAEQRRRDALAEQRRREVQEEADRKLREEAKAAAKDARSSGAPRDVVDALKQQAKVGVAPPVSIAPVRGLSQSAPVQRWKCRLVSTPEDAEPNPEITAMSAHQQEQVRGILGLIATGNVPLAACRGLDWSYLNKRAAAEKRAFDIPHLEAFDEGGLRRRR